jgi:NAD(P)-dependent dehydrogenase (short-subunit alcohol dehydrogenase family)
VSGRLDGKVCVVTGGTSGIGLATARRFAQEGAKVAVLGRDQAGVSEATEDLGRGSLGVAGDVARIEDIERLFGATTEAFGNIDVLMANAGIGRFGPFESVTVDEFDALCAVHFRGAFFTVQKALPHLRDGGSVILVSSAGANRGFPLTSAYNAAKAAVRSLARTFAAELAPRGIRVNAISPGLTNTPMATGDIGIPPELRDEAAKAQIDMIPMKRIGQPEEIAAAALFLASDDSSFFTGADLTPDGGTQPL